MQSVRDNLKGWMAMAAVLVGLGAATAVSASTVGKVGYSGNPATNGGQTCSLCHGGGSAPTAALSGPTKVLPGSTNVYHFTLTGGPAVVGGLNVSTTQGSLQDGSDTRLESGEITHTWPKPFSVGQVSFTFTWTAPPAAGTATLYAAGVSADGASNTDGDGVHNVFLPLTVASSQQMPSTVALQQIAAVSSVTDIRHAGDSRLFIVEQPGRIRIYKPGVGLVSTPFLDISGPVDDSGGEMGLLGLAFHPNYAVNGYFYVNYTVASPRRTRISRFQVSSNPDLANASSELILMEFAQPYTNHNGGALQFGPDGYLYIATGDGGSSNDPEEHSQNKSSLLGKLLRIDVDSTTGGLPDCSTYGGSNYRIPPGNPFADGPGGQCDEIWAWGLRNPWRIAFDRATGDLWIADVGQWAWEEVDFQPAGSAGGQNYGWDCYEGNAANPNDPAPSCAGAPASSFTFPVHVYDHSGGKCSVTGGYVYRGQSYARLRGHYLFGDYCTGQLWTLSGNPSAPTLTSLALAPGSSLSNPRTFGEDVNGELYVASGSAVFKIVDPNAAPAAPSVSAVPGPEQTVRLTWPDDPAVCSYEVYRGTTPYFDPATAGTLLHVVGQTDPTQYDVANATGNPNVNASYVVRAVNCSGLSAADSNRTGEFDFALTPGS